MSKKIISLIIVSSFIFSQISSAAPLSNGFLRPLALSERPLEGDFDGPGAVSRRGILQAGGALMLGHLIGENGSAEERTAGAIPYKSALGVSDQSAALVQKIRASQRRMLTNGGIAAASGSAASAVLDLLANYYGTDNTLQEKKEFLVHLHAAVEAYYLQEVREQEEMAERAEREAKSRERLAARGIGAAYLDAAFDQARAARSRVDALKIFQSMQSDLELLGAPFLLFKIAPPVGDVGAWEVLPPIPVASEATRDEKRAAFGRVREALKKILQEQIAPLQAELSRGDADNKWDRSVRKWLTETMSRNLELTHEAVRDLLVERIALIQTQIRRIDQMDSPEELLNAPIIAESAAIVARHRTLSSIAGESEAALRASSQRFKVGTMSRQMWPGHDSAAYDAAWHDQMRESERFEKVSNDIRARIEENMNQIRTHYLAMGYSVSFPQTSGALPGLADFQQMMATQPVPIPRPLTPDEMRHHTGRIKALLHECLEGRAQLSREAARSSARMLEISKTYDAKRITIGDPVLDANAVKLGEQETMVAQIERQLLGMDEQSADYRRLLGKRDQAILSALRIRRAGLRLLVGSNATGSVGENQFDDYRYPLSSRVKSWEDYMDAHIQWYETLIALGEHLPGVEFMPGGLTPLRMARQLSKAGIPHAKIVGQVVIGMGASAETTDIMTPGLLSLGEATVLSTANNQFGEETVYTKMPAGEGVIPASDYITVSADKTGFFSGRDPRSLTGEVTIERGVPSHARQLPAGEYNVVHISGLYSISEKPVPLGTAPEFTDENPRYLFYYTLSVSEERELVTGDGRLIRRKCCVPKKVMVYSTADPRGMIEPTGKTPEGLPRYEELEGGTITFYDIREDQSPVVATNALHVKLKLKKPSRQHPEGPFTVEPEDVSRATEAAFSQRIETAREAARAASDLEEKYQFVDFLPLRRLIQPSAGDPEVANPALALQLALQFKETLDSLERTDPQVLLHWRSRYSALMGDEISADPDLLGDPDGKSKAAARSRLIKIELMRSGSFMQIGVASVNKKAWPEADHLASVTARGIRCDAGSPCAPADLRQADMLLRGAFFHVAAKNVLALLSDIHPSAVIRNTAGVSSEMEYRLLQGVLDGARIAGKSDPSAVVKTRFSSALHIIISKGVGQVVSVHIPGVISPDHPLNIIPGVTVPGTISARASREFVAGYLRPSILTPETGENWKKLLLPAADHGGSEEQLRSAVLTYLSDPDNRGGYGVQRRQCEFVRSILIGGQWGYSERQQTVALARMDRFEDALLGGLRVSALVAGAAGLIYLTLRQRLNQSANREEEERNLDIVLQNSTLRSEIESNRSAFHEALTAPGAQIVVGEGARLDLQGRRVMDSFGLTLEFCRMCRERSLEARVVEVATEAGDDFIAQVRVGGEWRNIRIAPSPLPVLHVRYVLDEADEMEQAYARLTRGLDLSSRAGQTAFYDSGSDGIVTARAVISTGDERTVRPDTTIRLAVMVSFANDTGTVRRRAEVSVETSARRLIAMGAALMAGAAVAPDDSALITVTETGASDQSPGIFADQVARARALLHEMISRLTMSEIPASRTEETAQRNQVLSAI